MLPTSPHTVYFSHYHSKRTLRTPCFCQVLSFLNTTGQEGNISVYFALHSWRDGLKNIGLVEDTVWVLWKNVPRFGEKKKITSVSGMSISFNPKDLHKVEILKHGVFLNAHFSSGKGKGTHVYGASVLQGPFHISVNLHSGPRREGVRAPFHR